MSTNALNFSGKRAILVVSPENSQTIIDTFISKGYKLITLDGSGIRSKEELLINLSQVLKFPDYFGNNWDALEECLNDLEWLPAKGYVIQFKDVDIFRQNNLSDYEVFLHIIEEVSVSWKKKEVDFILIAESNNPVMWTS